MLEAKTISQLEIYKNGIPVGTLERTKEGCRLHFLHEFQQSHKRLTFSISTDKAIYEYKGVGLPAYFAGLLPEGLRLKALIKQLKTSEDDLFTLLAASGADPVGDIHFKEISTFPEIIIENELPNDFNLLRSQLKQGQDPGRNSLAGIQEKISADRLSLPVKVKKKTKSYILKFDSTEYTHIIENEWACLEIAKSCGLDVNIAHMIKDKHQQKALLVERFDRQWDPKKKQWLRFHQEDACQFLNRYPADKYRLSFQEIADGITQFSSTAEIEILNLLKLKAFSYLIGNGDLHAKNISLVQMQKEDSGICQLSPCYDLLCTSIYGDHKMALQFDGKNQNLKKKTFIEFGLRYQVPEKATADMLLRLIKNFRKNYEKIFSFSLAINKKKFLLQMFNDRMKHLS